MYRFDENVWRLDNPQLRKYYLAVVAKGKRDDDFSGRFQVSVCVDGTSLPWIKCRASACRQEAQDWIVRTVETGTSRLRPEVRYSVVRNCSFGDVHVLHCPLPRKCRLSDKTLRWSDGIDERGCSRGLSSGFAEVLDRLLLCKDGGDDAVAPSSEDPRLRRVVHSSKKRIVLSLSAIFLERYLLQAICN